MIIKSIGEDQRPISEKTTYILQKYSDYAGVWQDVDREDGDISGLLRAYSSYLDDAGNIDVKKYRLICEYKVQYVVEMVES